jgi:hypothetical protein
MKDQVAAQTLLEEIETAKLHQPTARQSTAFVARADGLAKRLQLRGNPASSSSSFPFPTHPLFPEQQHSNTALVQTLSSQIAATRDVVSTVEVLAREYRGSYEAVRRVETMCQDVEDLSLTFTTIIDRLENGTVVKHGDGTPPNLTSEACLEPTCHAVFLALLPSVIDELDRTSVKADTLLRGSHASLLALDREGIDREFSGRAASDIQRLTSLREKAQKAKKDITARVRSLQDARKLWLLMGNNLKELEAVRRQLGDAMETQRWKQQPGRSGTPLTPESPIGFQLPLSAPSDLTRQLDVIDARLMEDIRTPLLSMSSFLEPSLYEWLAQSFKGLTGLLESARQMTRLLEAIQKQAEVMGSIRSESEEIQIRIEDLRVQFDSAIQEVLTSEPTSPLETTSMDLNANAQRINDAVQGFIDGLSQRVPFVSQRTIRSPAKRGFVKKRFSSQDLKLGVSLQQIPIELPFELSVLDDAVRHDSNSYAMTLSGELESLQQKGNHLRLAWMAKEVDGMLASTLENVNLASRELVSHRSLLSVVMEQDDVKEPLQSLSRDFEIDTQGHRLRIARSFSPIRDLLRRMDAAAGSRDPAVHEVIYLARVRAVDDAELKFNAWSADVETLRNQFLEAQRLAEERIAEQARQAIAEAERLRIERERQEAAERLRAEEARLLAERERQAAEEAERSRLQEKCLAEELQAKKERQAEEAKRLRLEQEQREMEERFRAEEARLEEERRIQAENERRAAEDAERLRLEQEQRELEERLRAEEVRLEEERRIQVENARQAAVELERLYREQRMEEERLAEAERKRRVEEAERLKREKDLREAKERRRAEEARLEKERQTLAEEERKAGQEERKLYQEQLEAKEQLRAEEVRLTDECRICAEAELRGKKAADRARQEQQRLDQEKLHVEEARLAVERQAQAEREREAEEVRRKQEKAEQRAGERVRAEEVCPTAEHRAHAQREQGVQDTDLPRSVPGSMQVEKHASKTRAASAKSKHKSKHSKEYPAASLKGIIALELDEGPCILSWLCDFGTHLSYQMFLDRVSRQ